MRFTDEGPHEDFKISVKSLTQVVHNITLGDHSTKKCNSAAMGFLLKPNIVVVWGEVNAGDQTLR